MNVSVNSCKQGPCPVDIHALRLRRCATSMSLASRLALRPCTGSWEWHRPGHPFLHASTTVGCEISPSICQKQGLKMEILTLTAEASLWSFDLHDRKTTPFVLRKCRGKQQPCSARRQSLPLFTLLDKNAQSSFPVTHKSPNQCIVTHLRDLFKQGAETSSQTSSKTALPVQAMGHGPNLCSFFLVWLAEQHWESVGSDNACAQCGFAGPIAGPLSVSSDSPVTSRDTTLPPAAIQHPFQILVSSTHVHCTSHTDETKPGRETPKFQFRVGMVRRS